MSSELCKKPAKKKAPPVKPPGPTTPPPTVKPIDRTISGQSLRSKHLKIISAALYKTPVLDDVGGIGEGVQTGEGAQAGGASLAGTDADRTQQGTSITLGARRSQIPVGDSEDPIRTNFLNYYGRGLNAVRRSYFTNRSFQQLQNTDKIYFDVRDQDEQRADTLYTKVLSSLQEYVYINFTLDVPFDSEEVRANTIQSGRPEADDPGFEGGDPRISTYRFEPRYNLFLEKYENKVANNDVAVKSIPNAHVYDFLQESLFDLDTKNYDKEYLKYLSYQADTSKLLRELVTKRPNFVQYLEDYIVTPQADLRVSSVPREQSNKFTNLVVTQDDASEYFDASGRLRSTANYGFYLEIPYEPPKLQKGEKDIFKNILKKTNTDLNLYNVVLKTDATTSEISDSLLQIDKVLESVFGFAAGSLNQNELSILRSLLPEEKNYYTNLSYIEATKNTPVNNFTTSPTKYRTWDLTSFFEDYGKLFDSFRGSFKDAFNLSKDKSTTVLGETNEAIQKYQNNAVYDAFQKLMNKAAASQFKKAVDTSSIQNLASMFEYLSETPYEVLFYKISKKNVDNVVLQNFYIPNPDEQGRLIDSKDKLIKMFDSQVKYGERYSYDVFAYTLVLAKKYHYEKVDKVFTASKQKEYFAIFDFFKYYLKNIQKVKSSMVAPSNEMRKRIDQFLKASEQLVDDYRASQEKISTNQTYLNFIIGVVVTLKKMLKDIYDIVDDELLDVGADTVLKPQKRTVITGFMKNFFQKWEYGSEDFDKSNAKDIKDAITKEQLALFFNTSPQSLPANINVPTSVKLAIDNKYQELLNSWELLSRVFDNLTAGNRSVDATVINDLQGRLKDLSKYTTSIAGDVFVNSGLEGFNIVTRDYVPLMEIPIFTAFGTVLDGPPVAPEIEFVPFKGVNNKVMIKLKGQNTEYYEFPEIINEEESGLIDELIRTRGTDKRGRLLFKTDDYLTKFEIYRLEEKPKAYTDFSGKMIEKVDLQNKFSSFEYLDDIVPNKRYYYTFRSTDEHDNFSNPSPVYEFILNDDGGFIYPEVRIVSFEDADYFDFESKMQKYIQIRPSAQNIIFDPELVNDEIKSANDLAFVKSEDSNPPLGISSDSVWGKNFKLRITSKTSGKKVDINFTFTKKHKIVKKPETEKVKPLPSVQLYNK